MKYENTSQKSNKPRIMHISFIITMKILYRSSSLASPVQKHVWESGFFFTAAPSQFVKMPKFLFTVYTITNFSVSQFSQSLFTGWKIDFLGSKITNFRARCCIIKPKRVVQVAERSEARYQRFFARKTSFPALKLSEIFLTFSRRFWLSHPFTVCVKTPKFLFTVYTIENFGLSQKGRFCEKKTLIGSKFWIQQSSSTFV